MRPSIIFGAEDNFFGRAAEEIAEKFSDEIAGLVEGVTKLTRLELQSEYTKQSENLRKFIRSSLPKPGEAAKY